MKQKMKYKILFKIRKENLIVQRQPLIASIITLLGKEMASFFKASYLRENLSRTLERSYGVIVVKKRVFGDVLSNDMVTIWQLRERSGLL